ncbi:Kelch repeat F-box 1, KISS ME DEADLY 2 [Hibiscus trionum]|uniref:Kelch repeat F-box 1, KISS ME DEADLY 2 n=1 Tax=Hibiscus trionum TaxID=183268 RepID=A0A9W7H672_HIBTR|nr:Kelch repeat F-box 1, KISS ME DEADLY 2 [Hibiscus trionum]
MDNSEFSTELLPVLPEELGLQCLSRLPYTAHGLASRVCHRWRDLLQSLDFYYHRKKLGYTQKVACLVLAFNDGIAGGTKKPGGSPSYGIAVFDSVSQNWDRLAPVPKYLNGLPLFCQLASCDGKLVVMGGWDPVSYNPVSDVFIYDFTTRQWRQGKDVPAKRSFFAIGACSGRVFIAGGHDENKNASRTALVYDLRTDEWAELGELSQERDECEGVMIGEDEFWVVSGYRTESQGQFDGSADVYRLKSGQWRRVEGVWEPGRCPRSSVGIGKDGKLLNWAEISPAVRVGACGIDLGGGRVLVTGSEYQGAPLGFYSAGMMEGQNSKLEKLNVPNEFFRFVQSGCYAEI